MTQENKNLTIVELTANNVMNLKAIRITPDRKAVVLTGANEAGKSNVLNLIQAMLEGLRLKMPIREGEERADAVLDMGDFKISQKWTAKGDYLEVFEVVDGNKRVISSPRAFLDKLTGKMVDPLKMFHLMKNDPKKFRDTLANLVGLDLTDLKDDEVNIRGDRKLINDKIRDAVAQLKELTAPDPETPEEEKTFKEKLDEVNRLREKRNVYSDAVVAREHCDLRMEKNGELVGELQAEIIQIEKRIENIAKENEDLRCSDEMNNPLPEQITNEQISAAESEVENLEAENVKIREAKRYRSKVKESQKFQKESDAFSQKIERIQQDIQTRIADCEFPVKGLTLSEDSVLYEGKPLEIASSGRQIRIFTKMAIAMSPNVKVLIIRDGSLLDDKAFAEMCELASSEGYEIWMEKVDESGQVGIYIEDGEIKAVDGESVKEKCTHEIVEIGRCAGCGESI